MPLSTPHLRILAVATFLSLLLASMGFASPASAKQDRSFALFGSRAAGWGFTNTSLTIPGPPMQVEVGDNVTLNLTSVDGRSHDWFIDYNNNSAVNPGEPRSPNFGTAVLWNFTVSNMTGTFRYRSDRVAGGDLATMWGNITILPAGSLQGPLSNPLVFGGLILALVAVLVVAVLYHRRSGKPPVSPRE
jgi:heme/copper-type cytochrome/quinol oxidase subunit 2